MLKMSTGEVGVLAKDLGGVVEAVLEEPQQASLKGLIRELPRPPDLLRLALDQLRKLVCHVQPLVLADHIFDDAIAVAKEAFADGGQVETRGDEPLPCVVAAGE